MTTAPNAIHNPINNLRNEGNVKALRWQLAQSHPVLTFLLITFGWSWLFWLAAIPLRQDNDLLVMLIVFIGGYGPAVGGIIALGLKNGVTFDLSRKKLMVMVTASTLIFVLMILRYLVGIIPGYDRLPANLSLSAPVVIAALFACLVGGWVISNAFARNLDIQERMASILPSHLPWRWTLLALFFFPALLVISWGMAYLLGLEIEYPALSALPFYEVIPLFVLAFVLTALARGGMEEPGWRGMMQPVMQSKFSPLVAALIVSAFWSLWHLPLFLNGFYPEELVAGMIGGAIYRLLLAIFLAWFYNRSGGNLFLLVFLHTSFNVMVNYIPLSEQILAILWLIVVLVIVLKDKMYQKLSAPIAAQEIRL